MRRIATFVELHDDFVIPAEARIETIASFFRVRAYAGKAFGPSSMFLQPRPTEHLAASKSATLVPVPAVGGT